MAWTPPPGWPPPPTPGWSPPAGWQPDPSWGPPPPDWNFWPTPPAGEGGAVPAGWPHDQSGGWPPQERQPLAVLPRVRLGSVVTVVGALVAIVGSIGTWIHLSEGGFSQSFGGFSDGRDGPYVMGLAVVVGAIAVSRFVTARARWLGWVGLALSMILLLVGISDASDVHDRVSAFLAEVPGTSGGVGWGLWLAVAGGAISLLGSALLIDIRRRD